MADETPQSQRLFFALWPPGALQRAAHRIAVERVGRGRLIPAGNLHITLLFLGDVAVRDKPALHRAAETVARRPFRLELDQLDCWRRRGVVHLAPGQPPEALIGLHADLTDAVAAAGFHVERRRFRPHMTMARKARVRSSPIRPPLAWTVSGFQLMCSELDDDGAVYTTEAAWAFTNLSESIARSQ